LFNGYRQYNGAGIEFIVSVFLKSDPFSDFAFEIQSRFGESTFEESEHWAEVFPLILI